MGVSINWSATNGGSVIGEPLSYGESLIEGNNSSAQTIYVSHNGTNTITSCGLYIQALSTVYSGDSSASADLAELISWGDGVSSSTYGGIQINQNAIGSFPDSSWPTLTNKNTVDGYGYTIRTGVGDSSSHPITILSRTGAVSSGTIQTGSSPNVRFQIRIVVPSSVASSGTRVWELRMLYTATS